MARIKWSEVVPKAVKEAQGYVNDFGTAPTLRAIYYRLVGDVLPNTLNAYKGLSRALSKARIEGSFPWHLLQDVTRKKVGRTGDYTLENVKNYLATEQVDSLDRLNTVFEDIRDASYDMKPDPWAGQKNRVVIAIEKEAIMGAVRNVTSDMEIEIFPLRGYSSTTFVRTLALRLSHFKRKVKEDGQVHLLLITDFDPSGEDIARDVQERLEADFGVYVEVEKIMLTKEQILRYKLPAVPEDAEERAKMARDPRFANWEEGFYRVELDAMASREPQEFRRIINEAIEDQFDRELHDEDQAEAQELNEKTEQEVQELYAALEAVHQEVVDKIAEIKATLEESEDE